MCRVYVTMYISRRNYPAAPDQKNIREPRQCVSLTPVASLTLEYNGLRRHYHLTVIKGLTTNTNTFSLGWSHMDIRQPLNGGILKHNDNAYF